MPIKQTYTTLGSSFTLLIGLFTLIHCAQFSAPTGGPRDTEPPVLIEETSDSNYQTRFDKKKIKLDFDEFVQLRNPVKEIIISPPTLYLPKFKSQKRSVVLEFDEREILKENTTYLINFGQSVRDFNEGNTLENLSFVFSTGDFIDSLTLNGEVRDAYTKKPVQDVTVLLYDQLSDTVFTTVKPYYFARTDKNGTFSFQNLRSDTFQVFCLVDGNLNYIYDLPGEKVGFLDSTIVLTDTLNLLISLELFDEPDDILLKRVIQPNTGLAKLIYVPSSERFVVRSLDNDTIGLFHEKSGDTLVIWHEPFQEDSMRIEIAHDTGTDTIFLTKTSNKLTGRLTKASAARENSFHPSDPVEIKFQRPLMGFNKDSIRLLRDSLSIDSLVEFRNEDRSLYIFAPFVETGSYEVIIMPGAISDWYGLGNDSLNVRFRMKAANELGQLSLDFVQDSSKRFVVQVMLNQDQIREFNIDTSTVITLEKLKPGKYHIVVIDDENNNGRWDAGRISERRQSERVIKLELEELKGGWDIESKINLKEIFNGAKSN